MLERNRKELVRKLVTRCIKKQGSFLTCKMIAAYLKDSVT